MSVEGYGCSMSLAESGEIKGHCLANGFSLSEPEKADFIVIHTCAVKDQTEFKMLRRIRELNEIAEKNNSRLVVSGCLPKTSPEKITEISEKIILAGPNLEEISEALGIEKIPFSPSVPTEGPNPNVSIIPICMGCTNNCSFCCTKQARGNIRSFSKEEIRKKIESSLNETKEFWLTGQDTGAYGLDLKSSLPELLEEIFSVKGDFRIRIGMMNPQHLKRIYKKLIPFFSDERLYKFLHIPVQSGSDRILKLMRRGYSSKDYLELIESLRGGVKGITIANDLIVGFPSETEEEFQKTVDLVKKTAPEIVNISRYGARPNTDAAKMGNQLSGAVKKERSRLLTKVCRQISLERNREMVGSKQRVLITEKGAKGGFVGRTPNYRPVVLEKAVLGAFEDVKIKGAFANYLTASPVSD